MGVQLATLPVGFPAGSFAGDVLNDLDFFTSAGVTAGNTSPPLSGGDEGGVGWVPHPSGTPEGWGTDRSFYPVPGSPSPALSSGKDGAPATSAAVGTPVWSSIGYAVAPSGDAKAVYWPNITLAPVVLPELVQAAGLQSRAESLARLPDNRVVITGFSDDAAGMAQPAVWLEDAPGVGTFTLKPFALPQWAVSGALNGFAGEVLSGLEFMGSTVNTEGDTQGGVWTCNIADDVDNCPLDYFVLPPLPGFLNSAVNGFAGEVLNDLDFFMGSSFKSDVLDGVATQWSVEFPPAGPPVVPHIIDMNSLVENLPPGVVLRVVGSAGFVDPETPGGGAGCTVVGGEEGTSVRYGVLTNTGRGSRGTLQPHAAVLTPIPQADIPAVSAWGLGVMTLLVLTAATLVLAHRRRAVQAEDRYGIAG